LFSAFIIYFQQLIGIEHYLCATLSISGKFLAEFKKFAPNAALYEFTGLVFTHKV